MANKHFKLLDPQKPSTSGTNVPYLTDWNKCVLCQEDTNEPLSCPADSKRNTGSGYQTLAENLQRFHQIDCLPKSLDLSRLDDGEGIKLTFQSHKAKWHDSCRLKFNKTALNRAQKRKIITSEETESVSRKYTRQSVQKDHTQSLPGKCFFCDKPAGIDSLRKASTFDLDKHVRTAALKLGDKAILAKLSAGDLIAQDAQYHVKCLLSLYNKARAIKTTVGEQEDINHGIALGELVSYIDDARMDAIVAPVFKLVDLTRLYTTRLEQLGTNLIGRVHSTKLKDRIMTYFPDLEEHKSGRDILLAFNKDVGSDVEMAAWKTLGDLLDGSGWTGVLVLAEVATTGTADSFLKAAHVTRTRRAHQITACSLYLLLKNAYSQYIGGLHEGQDPMSLEEWCAERVDASPQFQFWFIILQLELSVLIYVRSIREGNFLLYIDALSKLVPWFFALGHTNYARWIPVHLRDMVTLTTKHPNVYTQFLAGNYTVKKTTRAFSAIALDQAHEQNNALVKDDGGAVGLTENPAALRRWMVSGPEMARLISEFQVTTDNRIKKTEFKHHEQTKHTQLTFAQDVNALTHIIGEIGNPFCEYSKDLVVLDSRDLADPAFIMTLHQIEKLGQEQYDTYVSERLIHQTKSITDPIKRNNLPLFNRSPERQKSKTVTGVIPQE